MSATPEAPNRRPGFLDGLAVLEIGDGVAGAGAAALLALMGALVTTVVDPTAPYRRSRPAVPGNPEGAGILARILEADKDRDEIQLGSLPDLEVVVSDHFRSSAARGDTPLVIADRVGGAPYGIAALRDADAYASWVQRLNDGAWVTISAFGLTGPRRNDTATELTISAASGLLASARDASSGHPIKLAGYQALLSTGQAAALAACQAVDLVRDHSPAHLDLSAQEAAISTGPMLALAHVLLDAAGAAGATRYGAPAGFYRCRDGLIRISAMEDHQWRGVVRAMGSPPWAEKFATTEARIAEPEEIDSRVAEWTRDLSKADAEARLQAQGVPATALYGPPEILSSPQLAHRRALRPVELAPGLETKAVGLPFQTIPPKQAAGTGRRRSLRGLRVLEAGRVLAIPLAGALLGALGAEVTKLEDLSHIDMYRRRAPFIAGEPGINRAAYFAMVNHSKKSLVTNLDQGTHDLEKVLQDTDVVIENFGARRADSLGISAYKLAESDLSVLGLSSSGFGYDGPFSGYRVYAYNLQTSCGLIFLTRNEAGEPAQMDMAWADLVCGYGVATIVAAWAVGPRGNDPVGVDFAMAELVTARFNEFLAAAAIDPDSDLHVDRANEVSPFAPNGVYKTADGWVAMSVGSDESFSRIATAFDAPDSLADARLRHGGGRFSARQELDAVMARVLCDLTAEEVVRRVRQAGSPCEKVLSPAELTTDDHLATRDFFTAVDHPEWGRRRVIGIPWRVAGGAAIPLTAPPIMDPAQVPAGSAT